MSQGERSLRQVWSTFEGFAKLNTKKLFLTSLPDSSNWRKLDEAKQGALIQVVDTAIPPDRRSFPKRGLIVMVATVVGLFVGICTALFQVAYRRMQEDIETEGKLRMLRQLLAVRGSKKPQFRLKSSAEDLGLAAR